MKLIVKKPDCGIMMLVTIWEPNEYANGHEGAQIELHFIKRGDLFGCLTILMEKTIFGKYTLLKQLLFKQ